MAQIEKPYEKELDYQLEIIKRTDLDADQSPEANMRKYKKALLARMDLSHARTIHSELAGLRSGGRLSLLTREFLQRVIVHALGDQRPLAIPAAVAEFYINISQVSDDHIMYRECTECGYNVPCCDAGPGELFVPQGTETDCPICGGWLELDREGRYWSIRQPLNKAFYASVDDRGQWHCCKNAGRWQE
jgi:hypothetical protein